jgi:ribosomal protein S25
MSERGTVKKKKRWGRVYESQSLIRGVRLDQDKADEIAKDIKNSKVVTPQSLSQKHTIRVSLARKILRQMEEDGKITLKYKNGAEEIYTS